LSPNLPPLFSAHSFAHYIPPLSRSPEKVNIDPSPKNKIPGILKISSPKKMKFDPRAKQTSPQNKKVNLSNSFMIFPFFFWLSSGHHILNGKARKEPPNS